MNHVLREVLKDQKHFDAVLILNQAGIVEYSAIFDADIRQFVNEKITGMHILDVYPGLKEADSSTLKVLKTGLPIVGQYQTLNDFNGREYRFINSTFPIIELGNVIGCIEVSNLLGMEQPHECVTEFNLTDIVTNSPAMQDIKSKISKISKTNSSVLIVGETGTGKELVAQSIHSQSSRRDKPFVSFNCSIGPDSLIESILFGTEKGAFTGAENREGLLEKASGGTLFLDEIHSMPMAFQAKILRFIEDKKIRKIGAASDKKLDVRIVAAMNLSVEAALDQKLLREDLYYRLSVVLLNLPPLRERREDIPLLCDFFIEKFNQTINPSITGVSDLVRAVFLESDWKGNVRELKHVIEGAFNVAAGSQITLQDIPEYLLRMKDPATALPKLIEGDCVNLEQVLKAYEKELVTGAIGLSASKAEAARRLGITRQTLRYKMERFGIR